MAQHYAIKGHKKILKWLFKELREEQKCVEEKKEENI